MGRILGLSLSAAPLVDGLPWHASGLPAPIARTSFGSRSIVTPPLQCNAASGDEDLPEHDNEVLEARAAGEASVGRKDGPAELELERRTKKCRPRHPKPPKAKYDVVTTSKELERITRIHIPEHKMKKPPKAANIDMPRPGGALVSRQDLLKIGPYPIEQALANLAAHVYYLQGDANSLAHAAEGSPAQWLAHDIVSMAKKADTYARAAVAGVGIPTSAHSPNLPVSVSMMPVACSLLVALRDRCDVGASAPCATSQMPDASCLRHSSRKRLSGSRRATATASLTFL